MKKQITYLIISFAAVLIGVAFYMGLLQKKAKEALLERIPASKPHSHVSPDGDVVEHTHTSIRPPEVEPKKTAPDPSDAKYPILRVWENLDLADIKRKYQPYTVQEMMEKWEGWYQKYCAPSPIELEREENYIPKAAWLQYLLDHGYPLHKTGNYQMASDYRGMMLEFQEEYDNPETKAELLDDLGLHPDATWEEFKDFQVKFHIVASINTQRAEDVDPSIVGGTTNLDGVFIPFSPNKVYVHVSEDKPISSFTGVMLSEQEQDDLTMYGIAPPSVTVVYTDEKGVPLPADAKPRFYERKMASLDVAEEYIEQMISDHEALFKTLPQSPKKTVPEEHSTSLQQSQQVQPLPHQKDGSDLRESDRRPDGPIDRFPIPLEMLPSEPPSRANIQEWFEMLQELHGGELPKDLRVLREVISELNAIRQVGKQKASKRGVPPAQRPPDPVEPPK